MPEVPVFEKAKLEAEKKLTKSLDGRVKISVHRNLDERTMETVRSIDHEKFREELRYSKEELSERAISKGFFCVIAKLDGIPVAFDFGYDNDDEKVFFSDDTATLIEGRGVGSVLFALEIINSFHEGYFETKLSTEERDDKGRPLMQIWGRMGFEVVANEPDGNIEMRLELTPKTVKNLYEKYIKSKDLIKP
jgi:hypothetical protein